MIRKKSTRQTALDFYLPFDGKLDPDNRWVKLAEVIPWDELAAVYNHSLSQTMGPPALPARVAIGAMIIKHLKRLTDEETIEDIRENPYCQYFLGFEDFQYRTVFVASLFVAIRKRLGAEQLDKINQLYLSRSNEPDRDASDDKRPAPPSAQPPTPPNPSPSSHTDTASPATDTESSVPTHSGMLIIDASVAPSDIRYPTDVDLLKYIAGKSGSTD